MGVTRKNTELMIDQEVGMGDQCLCSSALYTLHTPPGWTASPDCWTRVVWSHAPFRFWLT